jgi:Asp-tRNA(Asn)/Glu-tRNA(Gln) amidotransferase A subunit family amidase
MDDDPLTRRRFLWSTAAAGLAGCASAAGRPVSSADPASIARLPSPEAASPRPGTSAITTQTIAEAEKLCAVTFSAADRKLMVQDFSQPDTLAPLRARRQHALPDSLAPAHNFDPGAPPRLRNRAPRFPAVPPTPLPSATADIAFAPVSMLSDWLRRRVITSVQLTDLYLERLRSIGPRLECVVTLTEELARRQAREADAELARGRWRGPLHGVPWGAKDLLDTAGIRTTWGAAPYRDRIPARDAAVVRRLREAGAVLVAKLSLGELALGDVWFGGVTRNPWNLAEGSSGSSAGSAAAAAAGLCGFAIGSETLGSIVSPSMRCGTTGLRPTFGRVARTGAMTLCWSLDKLGPITRTVLDAALVLPALAGPDPGDGDARDAPFELDPTTPLAGLKVGYVPAWFGKDADDVDRAALQAARRLGLAPVELAMPPLPYEALGIILSAEGGAAFEGLVLAGREHELRQQDVDAWPNSLRQARFISAVDLIQAQRLRREVMQVMAALFERCDVMLGPSFADHMLLITNMTGHPSLTLRAGFVERAPRGYGTDKTTARKTPITTVPKGITLWGRLWDEATLCRVGMALEAELGVAGRRPPV